MPEKAPVLEALGGAMNSLQQIAYEIREAAIRYRDLTDAVTVFLIVIDASEHPLPREANGAVDKVRIALDKTIL